MSTGRGKEFLILHEVKRSVSIGGGFFFLLTALVSIARYNYILFRASFVNCFQFSSFVDGEGAGEGCMFVRGRRQSFYLWGWKLTK